MRAMTPPIPVTIFASTSEIMPTTEVLSIFFGTGTHDGQGNESLAVHAALTISKSHAIGLAEAILSYYRNGVALSHEAAPEGTSLM